MELIKNCFRKSFIEHPNSVGESYIEHGIIASKLSFKFLAFSIAELIHAIIPGIDLFELFNTNSFEEIYIIYLELKYRKEVSKEKEN